METTEVGKVVTPRSTAAVTLPVQWVRMRMLAKSISLYMCMLAN